MSDLRLVLKPDDQPSPLEAAEIAGAAIDHYLAYLARGASDQDARVLAISETVADTAPDFVDLFEDLHALLAPIDGVDR